MLKFFCCKDVVNLVKENTFLFKTNKILKIR